LPQLSVNFSFRRFFVLYRKLSQALNHNAARANKLMMMN